MKRQFSDVILEVEDWLSEFTYSYKILSAESFSDGTYDVKFTEYTSMMESSGEEIFTVTADGHMYNSNGDDVVDLGLSAYDYDDDFVRWYTNFMNKWYR